MKTVLHIKKGLKKLQIDNIFEKDVPMIIASNQRIYNTDGIDNNILHETTLITSYYSTVPPRKHEGITNWVNGSVRDHHSLFVSSDGFVYSLGKNYETLLCGETMLEDKEITKLSVLRNVENVYQCKDILQIQGKNKHYFCLARTKTGQLFAWGGNRENQLGIAPDRRHVIFPCLINSLYGLKIAQADCGMTVAIALSENFSTALSDSFNKDGLSDVSIELFANCTSETRIIYLHKCILLARCPTLLNLVLCRKLNYFLRRLLMDSQSEEYEKQTGNDSSIDSVIAQVDCTNPNNPNDDCIESLYNALIVFLHYLYVDVLDYNSLDLEKNRETVAMVQKLINFFYFLELKYWNEELHVSYSMVKNCFIDDSVLESFNEWNFSSRKFENMSPSNRLVRALLLDCGNSKIDTKFTEHKIADHFLSIMGKEDTCEDYKLTLQSKDSQLEVSIPLHKVILANSIEFFKGVFESNMEEEKRGEMKLIMDSSEDSYLFQLENVIPLLFHAYCGVNSENETYLFKDQYDMSLTFSNACECLAVANYYASRGFKAKCEAFISRFINIENVVPLLLVCETHEAYSLKELCIDFAAVHFERVQLSKEFHKEISEETREYVKKLAKKKSMKIINHSLLEKYWNNEIREIDLFPTPTSASTSISSSSNTTTPIQPSASSSRPSIFTKIFNFFNIKKP